MDIDRIYSFLGKHKFIFIILVFIIIVILYIIGNFYGLFATYHCLTDNFLWKLEHGKLLNCFKGDPKECKKIDKYGIYGFCYESNYYGTGMGQREGPYGYNCVDWVFDPKDCYPETCELANKTKRYGWCVDQNRAYLGSVCGPDDKYGIRCRNWIWNNPDNCPKKCPVFPKEPPRKSIKTPIKKPIKKTIEKCKTKIEKCPTDECICD